MANSVYNIGLMKVFFSPLHTQHNPLYEGYDDDGLKPAFEKAERAQIVYAALQKTGWAEIMHPNDFGLEPILAVHSQNYLSYLQSAYQKWVVHSPVEEIAFIPGTFGIDYQQSRALSGTEQAGFFLRDTTVAITTGTFNAALTAAQCALSGTQALLSGNKSVFALTRPPGHHSGSEICGGYCFFNNIAVAAQYLSEFGKVAILDIDYHAGNGTQDIFYTRSDVLTISLHADPVFEYPRYSGYAHEIGSGAGEGFHHNFPLPLGTQYTQYQPALYQALTLIDKFNPKYLLVSAGMDTYKDEPLGAFKLTQTDIQQIGESIAKLNGPTLIVMEGGYHLPSLGDNFVAFLEAFR